MGKRGIPVCPIVVITGSSAGEVGTVSIRAGAQDFVGKKWMTPESLTRVVENAVSRWCMARNIAVHLGVVEILASSRNEDEQLADALVLIAEQTGWGAGIVWLVDDRNDVLNCHHTWEKPAFTGMISEHMCRTIARNEGLAGKVWTSKTYAWSIEPDTEIGRKGIASACAFPILARGECIGVIELMGRTVIDHDEDLARVFDAIGHQIGQAIERTRAEKRIRENEELLRRSIRYYDFFVGVLGHDLRNPLSGILAGAELGMRISGNEKETQLFQRIKSSGHRMQRLIEQLLDVTRIRSAGGLTMQPEAADLRDLTKATIDEMTDLHGSVHIDLQISGATTGEWDVDRLAQVLSNLIGNAVQHATGTRQIDIRIANPTPDTIEFCIHNEGTIPQDALPTLFDPFVKAARGARTSGLGLGLYISQQIILAHGGQISVQSDAEMGTTFLLTLPRHPPNRPIDPTDKSVNPPSLCEFMR